MSQTSQWWPSVTAALSTSGVRYLYPNGSDYLINSSDIEGRSVISSAGSLLSLVIRLSASPGVGKSYRFQAVVNGGAASTVLDVTITGSSTLGSATGTIAISAGDTLSIKCTASGTPAAAFAEMLIEFDPTTPNNYCYPGAQDGAGFLAASHFSPLLGAESYQLVGSKITRSVTPIAGTITALYVGIETAPGVGKSWDFIITINGTEQASSAVNIAGASTTGSVTGLTIAVAAGDELEFKVKAKNGTATNTIGLNYCATFVPSAAGSFVWWGNYSVSPDRISVNYLPVGTAWNTAPSATESAVSIRVPAVIKIGAAIADLTAAPSSGKSWTFRLRKDSGGGPTNLNNTFQISNTATTGRDTSDEDTLAIGDLIDLSVTPSGTPTATGALTWAIAATTKINVAPSITAGPAVSYNSLTRTGPLNTPWHLSFTATDPEQTGANALTWRVYTAANRTGTLVASGSATADSPVSTTIAYDAAGLINGNQTLYLSVDDGVGGVSADSTFTLKRDDSAPTDPTGVTHTPNPILANALTFSVTFTPVDALSTDASELSYQLRTTSGGGGTLLDANVCTSGSAATTATVHDADLVNGFNALYLRITDGAGNVGEFVVSVLVEAATAATPDEIADALAGGDIVIYFTFEQRDNAFNFLADLSAAVSHASIDLDNDRAIVRLARFEIDPSELPAGFVANESNIAVNGVLDVKGIPTLFTLGLFRLDLSEEEFMPNDDSNWPSVDGADLTVILQSARFDEPYVIASGTNRIAAIRTLIESEGLEHDLPDDTGTFPIDAVGEPGSSKLDLINRILKDMNWFWLWSTEKGVQVSRERLNPEDEETAVIYSSVNEPRMVVSPFRRRNYRDQPNRVTVKIDDPLRTPAQATIENSDAQSSASTAKGPVRQTALSGATIADATMAQRIAEVEVREWAARALGAELLTDFDPRRQPHETYQLHIDEVEVGTYWRAFGWTMDLATAAWGDPLMHHRIGRVLRLTTGVI